MNIKRSIILIIITLFVCSGVTIFAFRITTKEEIDPVAVNDIVQSFANQWEVIVQTEKINQPAENVQQDTSKPLKLPDQQKESKPTKLPGLQYGFDYVVIDNNDNVIAATRRGLNNNINSAIKHRDTMVDIKRNDISLGKLIIYNNSGDLLEQYKKELLSFTLLIELTVALLCLIYAVYYDRTIFRPFRKLQSFARHVAEGKLDMPLEMDKGNMFGAFTESFDLMRVEINKARMNERMANQSKKELVASLSHDIKTPIASIKAVSELMDARSTDDTVKKQIDIINSKADQINTLITNLFNATLEELQELKVTVTEQSSLLLYNLIRQADYNNQVTINNISECLIVMDELRLSQVIDNVISNAYKYAGTSIEVHTRIKGKYLEVNFKDYGQGVPEEERPLIFNKFYRAKNASNNNGTGLGLYISRYIMNKMSGEIDSKNVEDGFIVKMKLKIA